MHDELDYKKNFEFLDKAPGDAIHILQKARLRTKLYRKLSTGELTADDEGDLSEPYAKAAREYATANNKLKPLSQRERGLVIIPLSGSPGWRCRSRPPDSGPRRPDEPRNGGAARWTCRWSPRRRPSPRP